MKMAASTEEAAKKAAIFRAAAKRIEDMDDYACCYALRFAGASEDDVNQMAEVFNAHYDSKRWGGHWMAEHGEDRYGQSHDVQNRRILALCFMAAILERP